MSWLEEKYIGLVSAKLEKFKRRGGVYNFRCVYCGDSHKDKNKARGYLMEKSGKMTFYCHNCNKTARFGLFLRHVDPGLAQEYDKESFTERMGFIQTPVKEPTPIEQVPRFNTHGALRSLKKMSQLPVDHPARSYITRRQIPTNMHYKLYYAPKFMTWVNTIVPNKFSEEALTNDAPRMIIPFLNRAGELYGFQGRSFKKDGVRYITIMLDPTKPKMFGLDTIDFEKRIYIFEGPIDSMFIPNSLAMAGSDMNHAQQLLQLDPSKCTIVMDNEPRNDQIIKRIKGAIDSGYNVCIWPRSIQQKDVNDMVMAGMRPADLKLIIDTNTLSGLQAHMALASWRCIDSNETQTRKVSNAY